MNQQFYSPKFSLQLVHQPVYIDLITKSKLHLADILIARWRRPMEKGEGKNIYV